MTKRDEYINKMFGLDHAADLLDQGMGAFLGAVAQRDQQGHKAGGLSRLSKGVRNAVLETLEPEQVKAVLALDEQGADLETIMRRVRAYMDKSGHFEVKEKNGQAAPATAAPLVIVDDTARMLDKAERLGVSPRLHQMLILEVGADRLEEAYNYALPDVAGKALSTAEQVALQSQNETRLGISPALAGGLSRVLGLGYQALIERLISQMFWGVSSAQTTGKSEEKQRTSVHPFWGV